jgi:hypothetical protein
VKKKFLPGKENNIAGIILASYFLFSGLMPAFSQEKLKVFRLNGYVTSMQSVIFESLSGDFINDNLIHNRLNFKAYPFSNITVALEFRNRLFTGDMVRIPGYSSFIGDDQGFADMSWNIADKKSFLLNSTLDRAWIDLTLGKFQATAGRQRINWGQTLIWNPNDIFNAYSFFDFDYVERPGSDAVRLQYFPSSSSVAELALKSDSYNNITGAGLFRFNRWGYDIQLLAGIDNSSDYVVGTGWSGTIGSFSFRGEASLFKPVEKAGGDPVILATAGLDKIFADNSTAVLQFMYSNNPVSMNNINFLYSGNLSAKDLAFSKVTLFGQFTLAASPLLNLGFSAMWFPDLNGFYAGPSIDYSIAENLGFSLIWQRFEAETTLGDHINLGFLRLKYSF